MTLQIDPAFKAAYRETQGQPVDAKPRAWDGYAHAVASSSELAGTEWETNDQPVDAVGRRPIVAAQQDGGLVERLKAATMDFAWGDLPDDAAIPAVPLLREAATALAEKDAQYERLAGRMDAMAADNRRLRAECEGLRAADDLYVVWSHEHSCWWRANSQGYARRVEDAGVYTRAEAISISHRGRDGWRPEEKPDELPIRVADLPDFARAALSQKETGRE